MLYEVITHLRERLTETRADCARLRERGLFLEHEASFLRESQRALVSARPKVHGLDTEGMRRHFEDGARRQEQARITSYNVCYTKLLRMLSSPFPQFMPFARIGRSIISAQRPCQPWSTGSAVAAWMQKLM